MPTTQSGVEYFVRNADGKTNYKETWHPGVNQASAVLQCRWQFWPQFRQDLLGTCQWAGSNLERTLPMNHPKQAWMPCIAAELIEVIGTPTADGDIGDYDETDESAPALAVVGATFQSVLYGLLSDEARAASGAGELCRYVTRQSRYGLELLELRGTQMEYVDTLGTIGASPTRPYPNTPLVYTWLRVPSVGQGGLPNGFPLALWVNITDTVGRINSDTFDGVYEPGTLLCGIPEIEQQVGPTGDVEFTIKYNFVFHSPHDVADGTDSWNVKYRARDQFDVISPGLYPVQIRGSGGDRPFRSAPFAKLFVNG